MPGRKGIHLQGKQREASWADCRGRQREQKPQSHIWVKERNPRSRSNQTLSAGSIRLSTREHIEFELLSQLGSIFAKSNNNTSKNPQTHRWWWSCGDGLHTVVHGKRDMTVRFPARQLVALVFICLWHKHLSRGPGVSFLPVYLPMESSFPKMTLISTSILLSETKTRPGGQERHPPFLLFVVSGQWAPRGRDGQHCTQG